MAATTITRAPINDTDANFRLWGKAISDQMAAGGWVKTTDTGQINWTTVVKPAAVSTMQGYEIWRSDDDAGSISEIYVKFEYGSAGNVNTPGLNITAGFGSDGAGNLTGFTSTRTNNGNGNISSTTPYSCNLAAGQGWFSIMMFSGYGQPSFYISLERTLDNALAEQNEILLLMAKSTTGGMASQVVNLVDGSFPQETTLGVAQARINPANSIQSGEAGLSLQFGQRGGLTNPSRNCFGSGSGTFGASQTTFSFTSYGASHTYIINAGIPYFSTTSDYLITRFE